MESIRFSAEGAVLFWSAAQVKREMMLQALKKADLPEHLMFVPGRIAEVRMALEAMCLGDEKVEKLLREGDEHGFEIVNIKRGTLQNDYENRGRVRFSSSMRTVLGLDEDEFNLQLERVSKILPRTSVGATLVRIIEFLGGVSLRPRGGTYWVHKSRLNAWEIIAAELEGSSECVLYVMRHSLEPGSMKAIRDAVISTIDTKISDMQKRLENENLGAKALTSIAENAKSLLTWAEAYGEIIENVLSEVNGRIKAIELEALRALLRAAAA